MYERFTDRARKVMQLAHEEAERWNEETIGTEHILLALLKEGEGVAAQVLNQLEVNAESISEEIRRKSHAAATNPGVESAPKRIAVRIVENACAEARRLRHNYVGTDHILLGLLRERESVAVQFLENLNLPPEVVRKEVLNLHGQDLDT